MGSRYNPGSGPKENDMSEISEATEAVKTANELAKTAQPWVAGMLGLFTNMVKANPQAIEPALALVPEPMKSQIRASMVQKSTKAPTTSAPAASEMNWPLVGGISAIGLLGVLIVIRSKRDQKPRKKRR